MGKTNFNTNDTIHVTQACISGYRHHFLDSMCFCNDTIQNIFSRMGLHALYPSHQIHFFHTFFVLSSCSFKFFLRKKTRLFYFYYLIWYNCLLETHILRTTLCLGLQRHHLVVVDLAQLQVLLELNRQHLLEEVPPVEVWNSIHKIYCQREIFLTINLTILQFGNTSATSISEKHWIVKFNYDVWNFEGVYW